VNINNKMNNKINNKIINNEILDTIKKYTYKPEAFAYGEEHFWDDPHISKQMLEAHLSQQHDAASRRISTIDQTVDHLIKAGLLKPGMKLLDLGCGPGLYAKRFAEAGLEVVGLDISQNSIEYAKAAASKANMSIDYKCMNFFDMDFNNQFDAVIQVYGELCTFSDVSLNKLLQSIRKALKKDGKFIFDVSTRNLRKKEKNRNNWYYSFGGFWRPKDHLVLEMGFDYPEQDLWLDQYIVVDESGISVYRNWFHDYSLETITEVLNKNGFEVNEVWNDLTGSEYNEGGDWIAIAASLGT